MYILNCEGDIYPLGSPGSMKFSGRWKFSIFDLRRGDRRLQATEEAPSFLVKKLLDIQTSLLTNPRVPSES